VSGAADVTSDAIPIAEGLFDIGEGEAHLIGSRCIGCGTLYFPQALSCRNSRCSDKRLAKERLATRGSLVSYTVQRYRPPPLFRMDDWAPYALGLVHLGEGLEVMGMLTGFQFDDIRIGSPVRLVVEPLYVAKDGQEVVTYKFAPDTLSAEAS
jgi:uncharacterized protein